MDTKRFTMTGTRGPLRLAVALLLLLTVAPNVALAADLTVCPAGPPDCQYTSIQDAVDAARRIDVIKVAEGTYTGVNDYGGFRQMVYIDKSVTIRGGYTAPDFSEPPDPEANPTTVEGDPAFVDPDNGNFHIGPGSAAIDTGVDAGVTTDIDDQTRPSGAGYDIGADEWVPQ